MNVSAKLDQVSPVDPASVIVGVSRSPPPASSLPASSGTGASSGGGKLELQATSASARTDAGKTVAVRMGR